MYFGQVMGPLYKAIVFSNVQPVNISKKKSKYNSDCTGSTGF